MNRFPRPFLMNWLLLLPLLWLFSACTAAPTPAVTPTPVQLRFIGNVSNVNFELDQRLILEFTAQTGIQVEYIAGPESSTERLAVYLKELKSGQTTIDIFQIDVIWPGLLADYFMDLNPALAAEAQQHLPAIIQNNTINGRLIGMPFFTDVGLLYYRTDLLDKYGYTAPPQTWAELEEMALNIQKQERAAGNEEFWGFVWQGTAHEGLTCNALEWQVSMGGGTIINDEGEITINNPQVIAALNMAQGWINTISPAGVTGSRSEDSRSLWQSGQVAFMRNWPYAYALGQAEDSIIRGLYSVTFLPSGGASHAGALGGWQLAIAQNTLYPEEALAFVKYMTSPEVQKQRALSASYLPTYAHLYDDAEILAANPFFADLKDVVFEGAVARPSAVVGNKYDQVSLAYFTKVHQVLLGNIPAETAVVQLEEELKTILEQP